MILVQIFEKKWRKKFPFPKEVKVTKYPCTIGRAVKNQITIEDDSISAEHAIIEKTESGYLLRDLGSRNRFFANGMRRSEIDIIQSLVVEGNSAWLIPLNRRRAIFSMTRLVYRPDILDGLGR